MSIGLDEALGAYGAAWSEKDSGQRLSLLEACWSDNGRYMDPTSSVSGRQELADHIGGFHTQMPGAQIELTSGASTHNSRFYFSWRLVTGDGNVAIEGVDFGAVEPDGRIREIVGFFGAPPAL